MECFVLLYDFDDFLKIIEKPLYVKQKKQWTPMECFIFLYYFDDFLKIIEKPVYVQQQCSGHQWNALFFRIILMIF